MTALLPGVARGWPWMRGIVAAQPGTAFVGPGGEILVIRDDGGAEEVNAVPRRWSIAADPTARRRP